METLKAFYLVANFFGILGAQQPAVTGYDTRAACMAAGDRDFEAWVAYIGRNPSLGRDLRQRWEMSPSRSAQTVRLDEADDLPVASWLIGSPRMLIAHMTCIPRRSLTPALRKALETSP